MSDATSQLTTADGRPLKAALATAQARARRKAFFLVAPLLLFVLITFILPIGQMLTHHASNGCNLQVGDLLATGTVSGKEKSERGCLLELTWRGKDPIDLPSGEQRRFLEDGDEIIMKGFCEREGFRRIGLGECRGRIVSDR